MAVAFIQTNNGVTLFFGTKPVPVDNTHINYTAIIEELKKGSSMDSDKLEKLSNIAKSIDGQLFGDVIVGDDGVIYYKNLPVHNVLTEKMMKLLREGWDISIWANFLNNLMQNPSQTAIDELYLFLEKAQMPITEDGHFLAFKKVRNDYKSIHDGKTDNSIGSKPSMPREQVDDNRNRTCSQGLHFCAHEYLSNFSSHSSDDRVLVLKINPADVVAIPSDYSNAKGRAWTYEVVGEIDNPGNGERDKRFEKAVDNSWDYRDEDKDWCPDVLEKSLGTDSEDLETSSDDFKTWFEGKVQEALDDPRPSIPHAEFMKNIKANIYKDDFLFGDVYTPEEILKEVSKIGSIRGAARSLGIAKSTFGDWVKKAKELVAEKTVENEEEVLVIPEFIITSFSHHLESDKSKITLDAKLVDDLGADSLDVVELILIIEEEYGIEILDNEVQDLITIEDVVKLLFKKLEL